MMKRFMALLLAVICMASSAAAEKIMYVRNPIPSDRLNLRKEPDQESTSLGKYYNGTEVTVRTAGIEWSEVSIGYGAGQAKGWMMNEFLSAGKPESALAQYATVTDIRAYQQPNTNAKSMTIAAGRRMSILGVLEKASGSWRHAKVYTDSSEGPYYAYIQEEAFNTNVAALTPDCSVNVYISNPDSTDRLHLRTEPSADSKSLGKYYNGCVGTMIGFSEDGEWLKVNLYGRTGWMKSEFLCIEGQRNNTYYGIPTIQTTSVSTPVYAEPDLEKDNYEATVEKGTAFEVLGLISEEILHVRESSGGLWYVYVSDTNYINPKPQYFRK